MKAAAIISHYIKKDTKVILALSGGPDSMFLFSLLDHHRKKNNLPSDHLIICTINHKTRPETDQEVQLLSTYCKDYVFESSIYTGDDFSERALRHFRYQEFFRLYDAYHADFLLLGHHLNDRVESFFLHMRRGASLNGMQNMTYKQPSRFNTTMTILRPLLATSKSTILEQLALQQLPYFLDPTNDDPTISQRNKVRHEVLPWLLQHDGRPTKFLDSMQDLFDHFDHHQKQLIATKPIITPLKPSDHWNADYYYKRENYDKNVTTDQLVSLMKQCNCYKNISKNVLAEIQKFLTHSTSGYKLFNDVYRFIAHGAVYLIKAPRDFRKNRPHNIDKYALPTDTVGSKSRSKYCIAQKIPVFRRNYIHVTKNGTAITAVMLDEIEY